MIDSGPAALGQYGYPHFIPTSTEGVSQVLHVAYS